MDVRKVLYFEKNEVGCPKKYIPVLYANTLDDLIGLNGLNATLAPLNSWCIIRLGAELVVLGIKLTEDGKWLREI